MKSLRLFLFLLPFAYFPWANQGYEMVKFSWFLIAGVGVWGIERAYRAWRYGEVDLQVFSKYKIWWGILALYSLYLIIQTAFFALSPEISFWGTYQRHGGLFLFCALAFLFLLFITHPWTEDDKSKLYKTLIASGTGVAVLSLVQKVCFIVLPYMPVQFSILNTASDLSFTMGRTFATMGHPNFLGQLLLITILITAGLMFMRKLFTNKHYIIAIVLQIAALLTTWNRASILTLLLIGAGWCGYVVYKKYSSVATKIIVAVCSLLLLGVVTWSFFHIDTRSADTRLTLYPEITKMISHSPLIGYGLESFGFAFTPYFPTGVGETENFSDLPDKAHNEILDILSEQGVIGLLFIVTLSVLLLTYVYKARAYNDPFVILPLLALLATELTNLAGFSVITHRVVSTIILGVLVVSLFKKQQNTEPHRPPLFAVSTGFIALIFMSLGFRFLLSDIAFAQYKASAAIETYDLSLQVSPFPYEYVLFGPLDASLLGRSMLAEAVQTNSYDIYTQFAKASLEKSQGNLAAAEQTLKKAESYCPNCPEVVYRQALLAYEMNNSDYFTNRAEKYLSLLPWFVFEGKETLDPLIANRQRIFLKEQKNAISKILQTIESLMALSQTQENLKRNIR